MLDRSKRGWNILKETFPVDWDYFSDGGRDKLLKICQFETLSGLGDLSW